MLGNAAGWTIQCTVTSPAGDQTTQTIGLDTLNISALDVVVEAAGDPSLLELRIVESLEADGAASVSQAPATDGTVGFAELLSFAERIRTLLGKSSPLQPQHVQGADSSPVFGFDVAELDNRLASLEASFLAAVQALQDATASSDLQAMRSALIGLADHGIAGAWPIASSDPAVIGTQASAVLGVVQPLTDPHPPAPSGDAQPADLTTWLDAATQYARSILGSAFPITPVFSLPSDSAYATSVTQGAAPNGSDTPDVMVWLRRIARIRNGAEALHDTLLAAETLLSAPIKTTVTQLPLTPGVQWAGVPFLGAPPSRARLSTVLSTPSLADSPIDPNGAFCGIVCDSWTEHLPGLTSVASGPRQYESAEVTGMAFTVEAPDAYAPQSLLLAIAPDPTQGWSLDVLLDTVQETLQLAKIRTIDLGDLPRLGRVLPVIHSQYNVDQMITDAGVHA